MRRRHRNRATWFPVLGFENALGVQVTLDTRSSAVSPDGTTNVIVVPLIPDIDVPVEQAQINAGRVETSLRDFVEGQSCIIERIVGTVQHVIEPSSLKETSEVVACCTAFAVIPCVDDGTGNPALSTTELDPWNPDNSSNPWIWRRSWILGDEFEPGQNGTNLPTSNVFGSGLDGPHIDTKGSKRRIMREQRIFMIHSFFNPFPAGGEGENRVIRSFADVRVIGRMVKATNRSAFK